FDIMELIIGNKYKIKDFNLRDDNVESKCGTFQIPNIKLKKLINDEIYFIKLFYAIRNLIIHNPGHVSVHSSKGKPWGLIYADEEHIRYHSYVEKFFEQKNDLAINIGIKRSDWHLGKKSKSLIIEPVQFTRNSTVLLGDILNKMFLLINEPMAEVEKYNYFIEECQKERDLSFSMPLAFLESV
ncbi:MAG: hypothetical protein JW871_07855, partial [Endomicrobiales bacterium]|nr:hypothetical protein [Endomicrobiales bacterium]